jgi:hypothetical protein
MTELPQTATQELDDLRESLDKRLLVLRASLKYWQTWEAEYEGLKDELESQEDEPSAEDMVKIGVDYGSEIIDDKGKHPPPGFRRLCSSCLLTWLRDHSDGWQWQNAPQKPISSDKPHQRQNGQ